MLAQTLLWFACASLVLTADKMMLLFGRWAPSLTLVLTLALRLVTTLRRKVENVATARACVGLGHDENLTGRVREGAMVLGSVTAAAFEDGVTTADSMTSRGFGLTGRSHYWIVRFRASDAVCLGAVVTLAAVVLVSVAAGAVNAEFFPVLRLASFDAWTAAAFAAYGLLAVLPLLLQGWEVVRWRSIASSI